MSLPSSRNTTYVASDPIKSADLNALQDCIVSGKHGELEKFFPCTEAQIVSGAGPTRVYDAANIPVIQASGAGQVIVQAIPLPVGCRFPVSNGPQVYYKRAGGTLTFKLFEVDGSIPSRTQRGNTLSVAAGTTFTFTGFTSFPAVVLSSHEWLMVEWTSGAALDLYYGVRAFFDKV